MRSEQANPVTYAILETHETHRDNGGNYGNQKLAKELRNLKRIRPLQASLQKHFVFLDG